MSTKIPDWNVSSTVRTCSIQVLKYFVDLRRSAVEGCNSRLGGRGVELEQRQMRNTTSHSRTSKLFSGNYFQLSDDKSRLPELPPLPRHRHTHRTPDAFLNWPCYCDKSLNCVTMNETRWINSSFFCVLSASLSPATPLIW